jgi:hypothetical protein
MRIPKKGDRTVKVGEKKINYDDMVEPKVESEDDNLATIIQSNPTQLSQLLANPIWQYLVRHTDKTEKELVDMLIANKTHDNSMFIRGAIDTVREYQRLMKEFIKIKI